MIKYRGRFSVDVYDLGGIEDAKVGEEARWIVEQYVESLHDVTAVDDHTVEYKVSDEYIDEELDRVRTLTFTLDIVSAREKHQLHRELFKRLRDIDTACKVDVELEKYL